MQEIKIENVKQQSFETVFNDKTYNVIIRYIDKYDYSTISVEYNGESIIANRVATIDRNVLIDSFGLGSLLGLFNVGEVKNPNYENFGTDVKLIYEE